MPSVIGVIPESIVGRREPADGESSAFLLVAIGCLGIATQLVLLRELIAGYGGNELSAGVTVAAWILCEAFGAWLAGHARTSSIVPRSSFLISLSVLFSLAAVPAAVLVRPLLGVLPGETLSIPLLLLVTFAVVLLPAASHGALFVTAAAHRTRGIGSAYVWEGFGTVLAALACFLLLNRMSSVSVVALSTLPLIAASGVGDGLTRTKWTTLTAGLTALAALAVLVFGLSVEKLAWGAAWRGQRVTAVTNSPYGKVVRFAREDQQLILYDGLPVVTVPPTEVERIEELSLLPVLCHPAPHRVLVLGSDLAVPVALARFRSDIDVTTVQLDPLFARTCLAALSSDSSLLPPLFSLVTADPVSYIRATSDMFDCIILTDATPSSLGASRLFSLEFYQLCRSHLAAGGLLATAGPGDPTALSPDAARIVSTRMRTLKAAFRQVLPVAADFPLLLASGNPPGIAVETLAIRLARLSETPKLLDSSYIAGLLDRFRQEELSSALEREARSTMTGVSSATIPRELFLNMVRENRLASPVFGTMYGRLRTVPPQLLLLLGLVLVVAGIAGALSGGRAFGRGFAILTSGFSGAAVSSLLLFIWQSRFGSVFSGVALLVAAFMFGTVFGAAFGSRHFLVARPSSIVYLVSDMVLAGCAATAALLARGGPTGALLVANCLAGAVLGFQFAVAGAGAAGSLQSAARRAGVLSALDLVGGSLGGIVTALVIVPVFGIVAAALVASAVKLASALAQLMPGRPASQS